MTQPIAWLDGAHWPYLAVFVFAFLPTEIWRWLAVAFARKIDPDSPALEWVRAVATALLAGVVAKLIIAPPGALAALPLWRCGWRRWRRGSRSCISDRRRVMYAVLGGEAVLIGGGWLLL